MKENRDNLVHRCLKSMLPQAPQKILLWLLLINFIPKSNPQEMKPQWPRAGISGLVLDKPLAATFSLTGAKDDIAPWQSAMYRDAKGSVRSDINVSGKRFISILDVPGGHLIVIDETERTAVVAPYHPEGSSSLWGFNFIPKFTGEYREIFGLKCRRVALFDQGSSVSKGEVWIAEEFGIAVQDIEPVADGGIVWKATSVKLGPPDAELFQIPKGYRTIRQ